MDDFAWVSLHRRVIDFQTFLNALFQPYAQGTIRPWSERLFFLAGWQLFGMEAAPYRVIVFGTMFVNLVLVSLLTRRLTGSDIAAIAAPVLWIANGNLYTPMSWTSAYNQILCAFFLLGAMLLWIRYTETGRNRHCVAQWIMFVLGFGALEINLVYPALAALHALCFARRYFTRTLPMFAVSAGYVLLHRMVSPLTGDDTYRMYFDGSVLSGLATFLGWSLSAHRYAAFRDLAQWPFYIAASIAGLALIVVAVRLLSQRNWLPLFCIGWFVTVLAPVLPLRNHRSDYYLTIPVIGLAVLGGYGIAMVWGAPRARWFAVMAVLLYALPEMWMGRGMSGFLRDHSIRVKHLVRSVAGAARQHPGKLLLLSGIDSELFWRTSWEDYVFPMLGASQVFLSEADLRGIERLRKNSPIEGFFLADMLVLPRLAEGKARVYRILPDGHLQDVTGITLAHLERTEPAAPGFLDLRSPVSAAALGAGWWPAETNHRWMAKHASLTLRGPAGKSAELVLRGFFPPGQANTGPVQVAVSVDGVPLPSARADQNQGQFVLKFRLPPSVTRKPRMKVEIGVDRTIVLPRDGRELGLGFGTIQVSP